jgi:hypothetical protein
MDPAVSSHYEVLLVPKAKLLRPQATLDSALLRSEWPPSPWILRFFSSATGLWEDKSFIRQGEAAGTVADMQLDRVVELWVAGKLNIGVAHSTFTAKLTLS